MQLTDRQQTVVETLYNNRHGTAMSISELFSALKHIDSTEFKNVQTVSLIINQFKRDGLAENVDVNGKNGVELTARGDALAEKLLDTVPVDTTFHHDTVIAQQCPLEYTLTFQAGDTLDEALYGMVNLIRNAAEQDISIQNKTDKLAALNDLAQTPHYNPETRAILREIIDDISKFDDFSN